MDKVLDSKSVLHSLRVIAGFSLLGAVVAGTFFGWLPALGLNGIHELGAVIGVGAGIVASARNAV
jgi:hypothetical protein